MCLLTLVIIIDKLHIDTFIKININMPEIGIIEVVAVITTLTLMIVVFKAMFE